MDDTETKKQALREMIIQDLKDGKTIKQFKDKMAILGEYNDLIDEVYATISEGLKKIRKMPDPPSFSAKKDQDGWYTGPPDDSIFWPKFKKILENQKWEKENIKSLDISSTKVVSYLEAPGLAEFKTKGLVVGYVQSGKTSNYTAVISKAADVGYKFFIVLTGTTNTLRQQVQHRLLNNVVNLNRKNWISLTQMDKDFDDKSQNATAFLNRYHGLKILAVVKKNKTILEKLITWLNSADETILSDCPVIIIDDESDLASIDVSRERDFDRSTINRLIITLINSLTKCAYIGYTATPFANVLIDPFDDDDLYPKDFIVSLPRSKDYFGPEKIFGRMRLSSDDADNSLEGLDIIRIVPDEEISLLKPTSRKDANFFQPLLSESLKDSILYFVVSSTIIKIENRDMKNLTMLIHTERLTNIQARLGHIIGDYINELKIKIQNKDIDLVQKITSLWNKEKDKIYYIFDKRINVDLATLYSELEEHLKEVRVVVQNYRTNEDILAKYKTSPGSFIIIGGDVLSRGLTLDGLIVSYFLRDSKNYDTLMQMGRWFGYHFKYMEFLRIWMTAKLQEWFSHLAAVEQDFRNDIQVYQDERNITPMDFQVRILAHPSMRITSPLKMKNAIPWDTSYSGKRLETVWFHSQDENKLRNNIIATRNLIINANSHRRHKKTGSYHIFYGLDYQEIIQYLQKYEIHSATKKFNRKDLIKYLNEERESHLKWNLVVISKQNSSLDPIDLGIPINLSERGQYETGKANSSYLKGIISKADLIADIEDDEILKGEIVKKYPLYREERVISSIIQYREEKLPAIGLLLIYPIYSESVPNKQSKHSRKLDAKDNLIGIGLYFPRSKNNIVLNRIKGKLQDR